MSIVHALISQAQLLELQSDRVGIIEELQALKEKLQVEQNQVRAMRAGLWRALAVSGVDASEGFVYTAPPCEPAH